MLAELLVVSSALLNVAVALSYWRRSHASEEKDDEEDTEDNGIGIRLAYALEDIARLTRERDEFRRIAESREVHTSSMPLWKKWWEDRPYRASYTANVEGLVRDLCLIANQDEKPPPSLLDVFFPPGPPPNQFRLQVTIKPLGGWRDLDKADKKLLFGTHLFEGSAGRIRTELEALAARILENDEDLAKDPLIFEVDMFIPEPNPNASVRVIEVAVVQEVIREREVPMLTGPTGVPGNTQLATADEVRALVDAHLEVRALDARKRIEEKTRSQG